MKVIINNKEHAFNTAINIDALIELLQLENDKIAIELNRNVIAKSEYENTRLKENDIIEIIEFIGGG